MKTNILYILILFLFVSCGSSKKTIETNIQETSQKTVSKTDKEEIITETIKDIVKNDSENIEVIKTVYDTDKPIDPITNRPPVKEETMIKKNKNVNETESTQQKIIENNQSDMSIKDTTALIVNQSLSQEKSGVQIKETMNLLITAIVLIIVLFLISIFRKVTK